MAHEQGLEGGSITSGGSSYQVCIALKGRGQVSGLDVFVFEITARVLGGKSKALHGLDG
jgi:hypothetical protein